MEKNIIDLTQEQINTMVYESCVLFCKHCGCGVPRDTCTSLGTCKEHDEYRTAIRTYLMEKKKKEYPKTYEECAEVLDVCSGETLQYGDLTLSNDYEFNLYTLLENFRKLLICRDAYWKIAGEERGLGKPWEPDWTYNGATKYCIGVSENEIQNFSSGVAQYILAFPTEEMRDAFYENFKKEIEICKELL